jgi:hypothetical protein
MYRNKNLLNLARGEECLLNIHKRCLTGEGSTTVACHENSLEAGKGMGLKADDSRTVWGCYFCHTMLDQGDMTSEQQKQVFKDAYERQIDEWRKIAENHCLRPWKVKTARDVLDHLGVSYG